MVSPLCARRREANSRRGKFCLILIRSGSHLSTSQQIREEVHMPQVKERTKEALYREAKRLGIKGRSKMNKGALKAAVERRR
jgi:hypothetical protein